MRKLSKQARSNNTKVDKHNKSIFDCHFSNGMKYVIRRDRGGFCPYLGLSWDEYHKDFSERDKLLDDAIERGNELDTLCNLYQVYDMAKSQGRDPIEPHDWLFQYATIYPKDLVISLPQQRILLAGFDKLMTYYDSVYGFGAYFRKYARVL